MKAKNLTLLTGSMIGLTVGGVLWILPPELDPWHDWLSEPQALIVNRVVGVTEAELTQAYGQPVHDEARDLSVPLIPIQVRRFSWRPNVVAFETRFPEPRSCSPRTDGPERRVRTLQFRTNQISLWAWVEQRDGDWVCVNSLCIRFPLQPWEHDTSKLHPTLILLKRHLRR